VRLLNSVLHFKYLKITLNSINSVVFSNTKSWFKKSN